MAIDLTKHGIVAMEAGQDKATEIIQGHFQTNQGSWKPLAAATILQRQYLGFDPTPILVRSETLKKHIADVRTIETSGSVITGTISPSTEATAPYGKTPISEYAAALDKVRPFFDLANNGDKEAVIEAIKEAFIKSFNG